MTIQARRLSAGLRFPIPVAAVSTGDGTIIVAARAIAYEILHRNLARSHRRLSTVGTFNTKTLQIEISSVNTRIFHFKCDCLKSPLDQTNKYESYHRTPTERVQWGQPSTFKRVGDCKLWKASGVDHRYPRPNTNFPEAIERRARHINGELPALLGRELDVRTLIRDTRIGPVEDPDDCSSRPYAVLAGQEDIQPQPSAGKEEAHRQEHEHNYQLPGSDQDLHDIPPN